MIPEMLHYDTLSAFKSLFYSNLLTPEHLISTKISINKMTFPDGSKKDNANWWGWTLEKNGVKYLFPSVKGEGDLKVQINIYDYLPFFAEGLEEVSVKGVAYYIVRNPISAKLRPIKSMSFKELVNNLSILSNTNSKHWKVWWFIALASVMYRANFRISSPPGFGKDSVVDTLGCLIGSSATIENPTLAKLEFMTMYKWLVVNEINDIPKSEWKIIEQFLLSVGAHKPATTKHSRGSKDVKEVLDLKNFSIALTYNDIDQYVDTDEYMDFVSKGAVKDRFPPLRFYGTMNEDFIKLSTLDIPKFVKDNMDKYKELAYNIQYYRFNSDKELKRFNVNIPSNIPSRWKVNIGRLLQVIDLYCDTQEEFNSWVKVVMDCMNDYKVMIECKPLYDKLDKRGGELGVIKAKLKVADTFVERKALLEEFLEGKKIVEKNDFWN